MAKFKYKARTKEGELQVGTVEAASRDGAVGLLRGHELFVLFIEEEGKGRWYESAFGFLNRVRIKDMMVFTRQFAAILSAKVPLTDSLVTLRKQTSNPILRDTLMDVSRDVDAGLSLSQALEKYPQVFSIFYVNMIRAAELTGRVEESVNFLADYLEKEQSLETKIKNSLTYPVIMIMLFFGLAGFMATVVFPKIEPIFLEAGVDLPFITSFLIGASKFISAWWWALAIAFAALAVLAVDYFKTPEGKAVLDEVFLRVPVVGDLMKKVYIARFTQSISILVKGGISIPQAVEVAGYTIGSATYRELLHKAAENIRQGENLSQAFAKSEAYFPPLVSQMTAIGEETGRLEDILDKISRFYTREAEDMVSNLVELIQPLMMVVIGVFVGILFASILIPIFELAQRL